MEWGGVGVGTAGVKLALRDPNHRSLLVNAYVCSVRVEIF